MAKLRADQLPQTLSRSLAPIYIVSGDEPLLVQESCDAIRAACKQAGFLERELYHADNSFDWSELLAASNSLSLFAEKKIIEVRIANGKPGDKGGKALVEYAQNPAEDNILLLVLPKIDGSAQRSKWFKALDGLGQFVQIWPIAGNQLPRWLNQRLSQAGLSAEPVALEILASRIEGNLLAGAQEIEKLKLIGDGSPISAELMASSVADSARYDVFGLVDKCLNGDARGGVKTLQGLRGEGVDATVVLWALAREIRGLSQINHAQSTGQAFDNACKQNGVWDKRKNLVRNALRRLNGQQLQLLIRQANGIDKAIKGMRKSDPWAELLDLTLNLAGVRSLSPKVQMLGLKL